MAKKTEKKAPVLNKYFFDLLKKLIKGALEMSIIEENSDLIMTQPIFIIKCIDRIDLTNDINDIDWLDLPVDVEAYNCTTGKKMRRIEITKLESIQYKD